MTWDGIVTSFHKRYAKEISISDHVEDVRKHLLRESIWIPRGRSESDEHNKSGRRTNPTRVPECDPPPEPIKQD
ncbi:unnamed protein product [Thelazia callipaeda]|uniref:ULP_PROTEASE domain-containing protein n=1 Tax=Thelazia callipaeda TaxID=103827 RepID=A0A0N5CZJ2_THECL|nr:unnamed protein product [Thelazia callipaeda]